MTPARWTSACAIGVVAAAAAFSDAWTYLLLVIAGLVFVLVALAFPRATLFLWLLLAPLATAYGTVELPGGIPDITFNRATIALVTVALLLRSRLQGRPFAPVEAPELAMLAMVVVLGLDFMARAENRPSEALQHFDERIAPCLLFVLARSLFVQRFDRRRIAWAIAVTAAVLGAHGTYQVVRGTGTSLAGAVPTAVTVEGGERVNESHYEQGRGVGPFFSAVEFGSVVAIGLGAALYLVFHGTSGWRRALCATMLVPIGFGVVASLTRSVWLAAYAALLTSLVIDRSARAVMAGGIAVSTVALLVFFYGSGQADALRTRAESVEPVTGRLIMYQLAGELALERPFTGHGSGYPTRLAAFYKLRERGGVDADLAPGQFHNVFLMILVEWGVGGLIAWVLVLVTLIKGALVLRARGPDGDPDAYYFGGIMLFATVIYVIQCLLVDTPPYLYLNSLYFFIAGVVYAQLDAASARDGRAPLPEPLIARA